MEKNVGMTITEKKSEINQVYFNIYIRSMIIVYVFTGSFSSVNQAI